MEIIDAQIHTPYPVQKLDERKFGGEVGEVMTVELAREAMDSVGVDVAVLTATLAEAQSAYGMYPDRFAGCVTVDWKVPDPDDYVGRLRKMPEVVSLRVGISDWRTGKLNEPYHSGKVGPVVAAAAKHGLPIAFSVGGNSKAIEPYLQKHPDLIASLVHLGLPAPPPMAPVAPDPWATLGDVLNLAKYPGVSVKLTGITALSRRPYPFKDLWPNFHKLMRAYGADRLFWGSDFTRQRMAPGTVEQGPRSGWAALYAENIHFLRDTTELSQSDKEKIFGLSIRRCWRWPREPASAPGKVWA